MTNITIQRRVVKGIRSAQLGLVTNAGLGVTKIVAGIVGNSYALIADGIESTADVVSSLVVWGGLAISARSADEEHPFGYGKAEAVAAAAVSLMLLGAAAGIAIAGVREILTPHHSPAPFTLLVLALVIVVKEVLARRVFRVGDEVDSLALAADAWHHRSDAITSAAAFIGITTALIGGEAWAAADDYAAVVCAAVIAFNGVALLRPAIADLMDRAPAPGILAEVERVAHTVPEVRRVEKVIARKVGLGYFVDMHVQADPAMTLHAAHIVSGKVKSAVRANNPAIIGVLIHMEPFEEGDK